MKEIAIKKLIGREVLIRVPVQYGKLSKKSRRCEIINIEKVDYKEAGIYPEDCDNQPFFKVTFRICKGEKSAGRKFSYYYPLQILKAFEANEKIKTTIIDTQIYTKR